MYLLRFLEAASSRPENDEAGSDGVEYRLACSGEFYNRRVITGDWRKSDVTRVLLRRPLEMFVASQPFDSYPQELCVRLRLSFVTEEQGNAKRIFLPDEDVIEDLCSVLTLASRRLVSPVCKTRQSRHDEQVSDRNRGLGSLGSEFPSPILPVKAVAAWAQRPITIVTSVVEQKVTINNPPPVGVDANALSTFLLQLPEIPLAMDIVYASRLYRTALELIESRPETAYLLLISTVESLARVALGDYEPSEPEKLATAVGTTIQKKAKEFGVKDEEAKQLGLEACRGSYWLKRKFKKFLLDFVSPEELAKKDPVFLVPEFLFPPIEELSKTFAKIYEARSGNLHRAMPFPNSIAIGTSTSIPWRALPIDWIGRRPDIPPVAWFERAVSLSARRFLFKKAGVETEPFIDYVTTSS